MTVHIQAIQTEADFNIVRPLLYSALQPVAEGLLDDFTAPTLDDVLSNMATLPPWLWLAVDMGIERDSDPQSNKEPKITPIKIIGVSALDGIIPGREAHLHGAQNPQYRKHPALKGLATLAMATGFYHHQVSKIKVSFNQNNQGVLGFCWQWGFQQEAHFKDDTMVRGVAMDILVYSLRRSQFKPKSLIAPSAITQ